MVKERDINRTGSQDADIFPQLTHVSHMEHKKFEKVGFGAIGITASEIVQQETHQGCKLGHRLSDEVSK